MIRWLEKLLHGNEQKEYEHQVRVQQQESVKRFAEQRKHDIDSRLEYLEAASAVIRNEQRGRANDC